MGGGPVKAQCGRCVHFHNDRAYLEAAMPGLSSMSSGDASVRADDGVCERHDRYLSARASCADFKPVGEPEAAEAERLL
ncbi:hypothetical protein [Methylocapsa sp. S129]|uniref:hypothetical protein n=1 Tax=Methylocapsa sp. S129 TaxID=1641869 RepID=UPI00131EC4A0|nr:hypothetical protein [Methylocapsa sp. S129]